MQSHTSTQQVIISTQAPTQDRCEDHTQPELLNKLIDKLLQSNASPGALAYLRTLQISAPNNPLELSEEVQQELEIMTYCQGWVTLVFSGPDATHSFVNQDPYLNPRIPQQNDINKLIESITIKKLDYRFPIDLLLDMQHMSDNFKQSIQVDGSKPVVHVPALKLPGVTQEEESLMTETWMWQTESEALTMDMYNNRVIRLRELQQLSDRPQARIIGGLHRNLAMRQLSHQAYKDQKELCSLMHKGSLPVGDEHQLEQLATQLRAHRKFLQFRARIFDSSMPLHLQIELAKNKNTEFRTPAKIGEDIYMFQMQTLEILDVLNAAKPNAKRDQILNIWHANRVRHIQATHISQPDSSSISSKRLPQLHSLAGSPMCVEMMLSCGQAGAVFNTLLNNANIQHLTSENGALTLANLWLDMITLNKICDFNTSGGVYTQAEEFVQHTPEPSVSIGSLDALPAWQSFCNVGNPIPAGLASFSADLQKSYNNAWTKAYSVPTSEDNSYIPSKWANPKHIIKKRKVFWQFGVSLAESKHHNTRLLGISTRLYALLPLYQPGMAPNMCFHPASDIPCKKKLAQIERQSRLNFTGTGPMLLSMALARHDLVWFLSKHVQNWYLTQGSTHRILERCTRDRMLSLEIALSKVIDILENISLRQAFQLAQEYFPNFGTSGIELRRLQKACSTARSGPFTFTILQELLPTLSASDQQDLDSKFLDARSAMVEYAQAQDSAQMPGYLEKYPVLLELVGNHFFNSFEFLRYVHGSPQGATTLKPQNSRIGLPVISAAVGMGMLMNQLELQVLRPLMEQHSRARYILLAAALVEDFAPSMIDGTPESGWWRDTTPFVIALDPAEDLPIAAREQMNVHSAWLADNPELPMGLTPQADEGDITMTPRPSTPVWHDVFDLPLDLEPPQAPPAQDLFLSTPPDNSQEPMSQESTMYSVFPDADGEELQTWLDASVLKMPVGTLKRWDRIMEDLPPWVACPGAPSIKVLHHLQGSEIALRPGSLHEELVLDHIQFATDTLPQLLKQLFATQQELRKQVFNLSVWAIAQNNAADFIVNVLAPMFVRLKENHLIQVAKVFIEIYDLTVDEAQAECLFFALSNDFWSNDILYVDSFNNVWIDYSCTLPIVAQKLSGDIQLSAMFLDGCGTGINEASIQHGAGIAQVVQAAQEWNHPMRMVQYTNNRSWNTPNPYSLRPVYINQSRYDDPNNLAESGWTISDRPTWYTTWSRGSSFSNGVFVDWKCMNETASTQMTQWESISHQLSNYSKLGQELWVPHVKAAIEDVSHLVGSMKTTQLDPTQIQTASILPINASIPHVVHVEQVLSQKFSKIPSPATPILASTSNISGTDNISNWTEPSTVVHVGIENKKQPSDEIVETWSSSQPFQAAEMHGMHLHDFAQTHPVFVPGTPSEGDQSQGEDHCPIDSIQRVIQSLEDSLPLRVEATQLSLQNLETYQEQSQLVTLSQTPFPMETRIKSTGVYNGEDSDDPDGGDETSRKGAHTNYCSNIDYIRESQPAPISSSNNIQNSDEEEHDFIPDTAFRHQGAATGEDSDDPDNQPTLSKQSEMLAESIPTPALGTAESLPVVGRKRAATITSPKMQLYKRAARKQ